MEDSTRGPDDYAHRRKVRRITVKDDNRNAVYNTLIVAAIIALVGAVIALQSSVAGLQASDQYQDKRLDRLEEPRFRGDPSGAIP